MNVQLNEFHIEFINYLKTLDLRFLIDDNYENKINYWKEEVSTDYIQILFEKPRNEHELKSIEKAKKYHYNMWKDPDSPYRQANQENFSHIFKCNYAIGISLTTCNPFEFEPLFLKRHPINYKGHQLNFISSDELIKQHPVNNKVFKIINEKSIQKHEDLEYLEFFKVEYLIVNDGSINNEDVKLWLNPTEENAKQVRKAFNMNVAGKMSTKQFINPKLNMRKGSTVWSTAFGSKDFKTEYQQRHLVNLNGLTISLIQ